MFKKGDKVALAKSRKPSYSWERELKQHNGVFVRYDSNGVIVIINGREHSNWFPENEIELIIDNLHIIDGE